MAGSLNKVHLIGHLGRDPEIRTSNSGDDIAHLSIATSEHWTDKASGERKERTEWHRVVIFNPHLAAVARQYLVKGGLVYVEGQLQTRKWTDQAGVEKYTTEIVLQRFGGALTMLGGRNDGGGNRPPAASGPEDYGNTRAIANNGRSTGPARGPGTGASFDQSFGSGGGFGGGGGLENDEIPF